MFRNNCHYNKALKRAAAKYGVNNMVFSPLIICREEDLIFFEQRAIDVLKPEYNARPIAERNTGLKHSDETKKKLSESKRGIRQNLTEEKRAALRERMLGNTYCVGKKPTLEHRARQSAALKGKRHKDGFESRVTEEMKQAIARDYLSGIRIVPLGDKYGTDHRVMRRLLDSMGVKRSDAPKRKFLGRQPISDETRQKLSDKHKGRKRSPEAIDRMRLANLGKKRSPESIARRQATFLSRGGSYSEVGKKGWITYLAKNGGIDRRFLNKRQNDEGA